MPIFKTQKRISVDADVAFAVAADVAAYKEFLPLLERSTIRGGKTATIHGESFKAELAIAYAKLGMRESFVSSVETNTTERSVTAISQDGPFRNLMAQWVITPAHSGCDIAVTIDYAFKSMLMQIAAGGAMDFAVQKVISAFETRALDLQRAASKIS